MHDIKDILTDLGYTLQDTGKEYRTCPLYRDSNNSTVLCIKKDTGRWIDFKEHRYGKFEELVQITLKLKDVSEARRYLSNQFQFQAPKIEKEKLKSPPVFRSENLLHIIPEYSYWVNRGVLPDTLKLFESGVMKSGKMENRYVFPIFDKRNRFVGAAGRDLTEKSSIKWKLVGEQRLWAYPLKYNLKYLMEKKEIILVESIGDMLALWDCGIKNIIVTFGLAITSRVKQVMMAIDPKKIHIAFNNDANQAGNIAADKAYAKLSSQFDQNQLEISLPSKNDFGCMNKSEILQWKNQIKR